MSYIDEKTTRPVSEPTNVPLQNPAGTETPMAAISTDRLYRLAAMTAGIFFLATLI